MEIIPFEEIKKIGEVIATSGLFGVKNPEQAIALCLLAQAEGLHPAVVARDYYIIEGKPTLKADAMLARFQKSGGRVVWQVYTDKNVTAVFSHPQGGEITITWDTARAMQAGLSSKQNWQKYPRSMLRARVISEGIRTVYPNSTQGLYVPEEVDFVASTIEEPKKLQETKTKLQPKKLGEIIKQVNEKHGLIFSENLEKNREIYRELSEKNFSNDEEAIKDVERLLNV